MQQVLRKGLSEIVIEDVPEPLLKGGEVKILTAYSLISTGTEVAGLHPDGLVKEVIRERNKVHNIISRAVSSQGFVRTVEAVKDKLSELSITGYAGAGVIIEKGSEIEDLEVGQHVAYGGINTGHAEIVCAPRNLVAKIPENVELKEAALTTIGSIALHAVRLVGPSLGDTIAVIGLGLVGQLVVQLAKLGGARVIAMDINSERVQKAVELGAEQGANAAQSPEKMIMGLTNGNGVDAVIICASSKTSAPMDTAIRIARSRAHVVVVGMIKMEMPWERVYLKELKVTVSRAYGPGSYDPQYEDTGVDYPIDYVRWTENRNMEEFLRLISCGLLRAGEIISRDYPFDQAPQVFKELTSGDTGLLAAVLSYPSYQSRKDGLSLRKNRYTKFEIKRSEKKDRAGNHIYRVGLIGVGNIARWVHLPNARKHPKLSLRSVCTPKGYKAKFIASKHGCDYCTTDYEEILDDKDIDLVMISTRHDLHARIAIAALQAGKHVFVEKPMALSMEDCMQLVDLVKNTGLGFMVNFNRRYSPMYESAKQAVAGKGPQMISMRMNNPDITADYWMSDPKVGGGAIVGEGCHFFDLMSWFTDSLPVTVCARELSFKNDHLMSKNNLACVVSFEDGSVGNLIYQTVGNAGLGLERVEVCAAGSSAIVEDMRSSAIWSNSSKPKKKTRRVPDKGYYRLLCHFLEALESGQDFTEEALAGARATLCGLTALKSLITGKQETLERLS